ncbi:hypothetical protein EE612_029077 [Oryza sativa]|uniref:Ribosomal RNA-processing protein 14/surfeit locus protein 6 C-terminal domain-containing protein n=1 Tax=Oryza glumipatula TaxID=40148 RepID=A0A0D9ZYC2_9ORYZ|nr:hypothetical protein EE612_029077 [Oryza sativa]
MGRKPSSAAAVDHGALSASAKAADDLLAASAGCGGAHGHSLFFDALVQLIPPRFYLSAADEDRPWYQGLSKSAKAAMKAQSRANVKAARRARLDPSAPPSSTLDLLKKSLADQDAHDSSSSSGEDASDDDDDDDDDEVEEREEDEGDEEGMQLAPAAVVSEDRSVTYEELRERLHRRIAELRGNRCTRPEFLNKPKREKGKKGKKGKDVGKKRKREDGGGGGGAQDGEGKDGKKSKKEEDSKAPDIVYGNVWVDPKEARRRKKRRIKNKKKALEEAKRMQQAKEDPEKATKLAWDLARRRAAGEKVHDDPKLIKESMKKDKKRQQKHAEQWKERQKMVDKQKKERQSKRTENIRERANQKKMRKIEKREKKLMRPGFEGRKEGYVNE